MLVGKNKVTIRQAFIIFIVSTLSPAIRLFPTDCARLGEEAAWIAPIISAVPLLLICVVLNAFFKNQNAANLADVFTLSLGKIAGKTVISFYLFWSVILYFLYIRYYVERLMSSLFPNSDMRFFIITIMIVVYLAARGKIEAFARFSELSFLVFTVVLTIFFILLIPNVKMSNLFPLTYHDIIPAAKATYPVLGIWGYITLVFFLGENIMDKDRINKIYKKSVLFIAVMASLTVLFVVGSLGYKVVQRMSLPFFNATKLITVMETLDRLESVLLAIWVVADFIVITLFVIIIMHIMKSLFSVSESKYFASPVILFGYVGSQFLTSNRFEFELFSNTVGLTGNIVVCFIIPAIVLVIGKLRRKI